MLDPSSVISSINSQRKTSSHAVQQASLSFRDAVDHLDIPKFIRLGNQVDPKAPFGSPGPKVLGFTKVKTRNP